MTARTVVFCADARPEAGGGHMSRCINLARALQPSCAIAFALAADAAPQWHAQLCDEGIDIVGDGTRSDAAVAVLDGYKLQSRDVEDWKRNARTLVMIEDLGRHFAGVDLCISFAGPPPAGARVLAGPQFALLDARYARPVKPQSGDAGGVLVTCGLRDSAGLTGFYLDALARCGGISGKAITVVLGSAAPHRDSVQRQAQDLGARLLFDVTDMAALYDDAGLVLGAGGMSLFERMARGRASVTIVAAENQAYAAAQMAKLGGTLLAGNVETINTAAMTKSIAALLVDREARAKMGNLARQAIDGLGTERVAREILALTADADHCAPAAAGN